MASRLHADMMMVRQRLRAKNACRGKIVTAFPDNGLDIEQL
ncbi:hypothetical protein [Lelliottia amnigena]|nr:hypothetical protein [Lelliottia amnigena]